jgi:hypothetical protein
MINVCTIYGFMILSRQHVNEHCTDPGFASIYSWVLSVKGRFIKSVHFKSCEFFNDYV